MPWPSLAAALASGRRGEMIGGARGADELDFGVDGRVGVDGEVTGVGTNAGGTLVAHIRPCCTASRVSTLIER